MSGDPDLGGWRPAGSPGEPVAQVPTKRRPCGLCEQPLGAPERPWKFTDGLFVCLVCAQSTQYSEEAK